ncbi:MAG: trypsin-like serine protease [Rickettsiales bacterium]|jgi:S1-C subfamily serine protease|nr:trypsin-like serine protease [Rickettsiales bacterium]
MPRIIAVCLLLLIALLSVKDAVSAEAKESPAQLAGGYALVSSGTGFFISHHYIITNEHVVQNCQSISIRGDVNLPNTIPPTSARIVKVDKEKDLALLETNATAPHIGVLRANSGIKKGDPVLVMGYPLEHGRTGDYHVEKSNITAVDGEFNNEKRVEFTDSVQKGNSGGPLLDGNGNIIGVIVGMLSYYHSVDAMNSDEPFKRTSVAISLAELKKFLKSSNIFYRLNTTFGKIPDERLESNGRYIIVNVHCVHADEDVVETQAE